MRYPPIWSGLVGVRKGAICSIWARSRFLFPCSLNLVRTVRNVSRRGDVVAHAMIQLTFLDQSRRRITAGEARIPSVWRQIVEKIGTPELQGESDVTEIFGVVALWVVWWLRRHRQSAWWERLREERLMARRRSRGGPDLPSVTELSVHLVMQKSLDLTLESQIVLHWSPLDVCYWQTQFNEVSGDDASRTIPK